MNGIKYGTKRLRKTHKWNIYDSKVNIIILFGYEALIIRILLTEADEKIETHK